MKSIAIVSHKGGAGKTTTAVMLARELADREVRVLLIDADRHRGSGILLGMGEPARKVQPTRHRNIRYFCSADLAPTELAIRLSQLDPWAHVAVIDTPSLDDPLAQAWIRLAAAAILVVPVEPIGFRTLGGAIKNLAAHARSRPSFRVLGILPTMYAERDPVQRSLFRELQESRRTSLLDPPIPADPLVAQAVAENAALRTLPREQTQLAYRAIAQTVLRELQPPRECPRPSAPEVPVGLAGPAPAVPPRVVQLPRWAVPAAAGVFVANLGLGFWAGWTVALRAHPRPPIRPSVTPVARPYLPPDFRRHQEVFDVERSLPG
jgi:cellulose biosynthesis protein BcsQ